MTDDTVLALLAFVALWWVLSPGPKGNGLRIWTWRNVAFAIGVGAAFAAGIALGTASVLGVLSR
jgi:hypothetical protein